ncbi:hypothetical protein QEH59_18595 [Coraliomargarita sp. SDUM461004]|uniref:Uncharacterized protein n=1 Tax=Thalassobacterium sedimentorum TaxID=3041258 RepID=A0ABU1ANS1_9BACT|nr:hypothetical protein [Coraliomargarita sp. SDUM461004]MDQ8196445.1 hypothetical protein [Coraliomargarita sp. SDUM461004]
MNKDHIAHKFAPYAVIILLYGCSALLSFIVVSEHPHKEYYSIIGAYLFGFFYLPVAFGHYLAELGINKEIGIGFILAYWPMSIFLKYKYIKKRSLLWLVPLALVIILPALKIGEYFIATMSI